jgi:hypothetical protein
VTANAITRGNYRLSQKKLFTAKDAKDAKEN